jgi:hypothetical protein
MVRELLRRPGVPAPAGNVVGQAPPKPTPPPVKAAAPAEIGQKRSTTPSGDADFPAKDTLSRSAPGDVTSEGTADRRATDEPPIDLNPRGLDITDGEYEFLGRLGRLLSPSPRAIKRFVNTFRLLNVALAESDVADEELQPSHAEVRMLLLAILVGMPDLSRWLQQVLRDGDAGYLATTPMIAVMEDSRQRDGAAAIERAIPQWNTVRQWIEEQGEPWTTMPAARVRPWLEPVGRYTFNLTRSTTGGTPSPRGGRVAGTPPTSRSGPE